MKDYQLRVLEESKELFVKLDKLKTFMNSSDYKMLPTVERETLSLQLHIMNSYYEILSLRLRTF